MTSRLIVVNAAALDKRRDLLKRYMAAYRRELDHFLDVIELGVRPLVSAADGVQALVLADAAMKSLRESRVVRID